jgi:nondiscriminating glutamyl-tRNA synthetase
MIPNAGGDRPIRVRMAPSPTGPLHIGTARTSLYNYLFARHAGGTYVLRVEDTDTARSTIEFERDIIDNLHWLGIAWDEGPQVAGSDDIGPYGPYHQSQRLERYAAEAERLLVSGAAYPCYCTPEELEAVRREQEARKQAPRYNGRCRHLTDAERADFEASGRRPTIRFRVPDERVVFDDVVRGRVEIEADALGGDRVIVRSDGSPLYHFTVAVDDHAMEITHVIRGEDHLSNTPLHILLFRALGYPEPVFAHLPLILNPDRTKMSKRKSQTAITAYREQGYLPETLVNFLAFLGWSPGTEEELFSLDALTERFELEHVHKGGAVFDADRLDHLNGVYIRGLSDAELARRLRPFVAVELDDATLLAIAPLIRERLVRLADAAELVAFLAERDDVVATRYAAEALLPKRADARDTADAMRHARETLASIPESAFVAEELEERCRAAADAFGWKAGDFFKPIRVAVTGRTVSPPLFGSMALLGREHVLRRLDAGLDALVAEAGPAQGTAST